MKEETKEHFIVLTPDSKKMLYDGTTVSDRVYLPLGSDTSRWEEITKAKARKIKKDLEDD